VHGETAHQRRSYTLSVKRADQLARHRRRGERHRAARAAARPTTDQRADQLLGAPTSVTRRPRGPSRSPRFRVGRVRPSLCRRRATQWHARWRLSRDRCRATGGGGSRGPVLRGLVGRACKAPDGTSPVAAAPITMSVSDPGIRPVTRSTKCQPRAWRVASHG